MGNSDSKGTLILNRTQLFKGTQFTQDTIRYLHKKGIGLPREADELQKTQNAVCIGFV